MPRMRWRAQTVLPAAIILPLAQFPLALAAALPAAAQTAPPQVVNCAATDDDLVEARTAADCHGRVISDQDAETIRRNRAERIRRAIASAPPPVASPLRKTGIGTGFFISDDSLVLTNNHVVDGCGALTVETTVGTVGAARTIARDPADDLALLKADVASPAVAVFRDKVDIASQPIAIVGYPNHGLVPLNPSTVPGLLTGPELPDGRHFAFHADVRPGNSGGPVLDEHGLVVGVVFAKVDTVKMYERNGILVRDIGFAIANGAVRQFLAGRNVSIRIAAGTAARPVASLNDYAKPFVSRVACWK